MQDLAPLRFSGSIISYPQRGPWGDSRYHGNCSGHVVRGFLATYHAERSALFVDAMEGSGTSRDVAGELGVRYAGFDLRNGFDIVHDDLLAQLPEEAGSVFLHPPYAGMVSYSARQWGDVAHAADLSSAGEDIEAFAAMLQAALQNAYRALRPAGHYAVLLGAWRKNGTYHDLPHLARTLAPGELVDVLIKAQHNTRSGRQSYGGNFVPIEHETLLVFRRTGDGTIFGVTCEMLNKLSRLHAMTWKNLVAGFVRERGEVTLQDLYAGFDGHPRAARNPNYQAKLRQVVQDESTFRRLGRGRYALAV